MPSAIAPASLRRVDFNDLDKVISTIEQDGGVILTGFTTLEVVAQVNSEVEPYLNNDKPWKVSWYMPNCRNSLFSPLAHHVDGNRASFSLQRPAVALDC